MPKKPDRAKHLYNGPAHRNRVARDSREIIKQKAKEILSKVKTVPTEQMNAWDKHAIKQVAEISGEQEVEDLRREIAALMRLAGQHYGVSKAQFWLNYNAKQN